MTSSQDLTNKIVKCTDSFKDLQFHSPELFNELFSGSQSALKVFTDIIYKMVERIDEAPANKFYALYLLLKACEATPSHDLIYALLKKEKLVGYVYEASQFPSDHPSQNSLRGRTFFSSYPTAEEGVAGINYVRLCLEIVKFWHTEFGGGELGQLFQKVKSDINFTLSQYAFPTDPWYIGKKYQTSKELALIDLNKEKVPFTEEKRSQEAKRKTFGEKMTEYGVFSDDRRSKSRSHMEPKSIPGSTGSLHDYDPSSRNPGRNNPQTASETSSIWMDNQTTDNSYDKAKTPNYYSDLRSGQNPLQEESRTPGIKNMAGPMESFHPSYHQEERNMNQGPPEYNWKQYEHQGNLQNYNSGNSPQSNSDNLELKKQNEALTARLRDLQQEIEDLKYQNGQLKKENGILQANLNDSKQKTEGLTSTVSQLAEENQKLKENVALFKKENENLLSQLTASPMNKIFAQKEPQSWENSNDYSRNPVPQSQTQNQYQSFQPTPAYPKPQMQNGGQEIFQKQGTQNPSVEPQRRIFKKMVYEKPRMVLTEKDFAS